MNTMETIRARASYRDSFTEAPVPREDLREILEAGYLAPSGCNRQTTRIVGVDDPALVKALAEIYGAPWAATSRAAVLLLTQETPCYKGDSYHVQDYAAAAQNLLLAIADKGYATTWIEGQVKGEKGQKMAALLGVPEELTVAVYLPIGVPAKPLTHVKKLPMGERVFLNGYGKPLD